MIALGLAGITGKMGQAIANLALQNPFFNVTQELGRSNWEEKIPAFFTYSHVVIDFTRPEATLYLLESNLIYKKPMVIGTTGLGQDVFNLMEKVAKVAPIFYAPNMSLGIALMGKLAALAAKTLGDEFDATLVDIHHKNKVDAPSGTALFLEKSVAPRPLDINSIRAGAVVGVHELSFFGGEEELCLTHRAYNRQVFAKGALKAAQWVVSQNPGLYSMDDLLTL